MRKIIAATILLLGAAGAAFSPEAYAQEKVMQPAPVPNREADRSAPADRAGRSDGSERAAPFSGLPSALGAGSGQGTPSTLASPQKDGTPSPSVSR